MKDTIVFKDSIFAFCSKKKPKKKNINSVEGMINFVRLECIAGYYGEECGSICGYCLDNTTCHHVTGSCNEGCQSGYQEPNCTEGDSLDI